MGFRLPSVVALVVTIASIGYADEFAIETQIFREGETKPRSRNLTVFWQERIYDFSLTPAGHITVFDEAAKRFALFDTQQRVQASLAVDELVRFVAIEQSAAEKSKTDLIRFAASPEFETTFDATTGELTLTSSFWEYRVETKKVGDKSEQQQYDAFANWFTQLNALFSPTPPGVRMELNRELASRSLLPERVVAHIKKDGRVYIRQESRHRLIGELGERERQLLDQSEQARAIYRLIPFHEYRLAQLPAKANR